MSVCEGIRSHPKLPEVTRSHWRSATVIRNRLEYKIEGIRIYPKSPEGTRIKYIIDRCDRVDPKLTELNPNPPKSFQRTFT